MTSLFYRWRWHYSEYPKWHGMLHTTVTPFMKSNSSIEPSWNGSCSTIWKYSANLSLSIWSNTKFSKSLTYISRYLSGPSKSQKAKKNEHENVKVKSQILNKKTRQEAKSYAFISYHHRHWCIYISFFSWDWNKVSWGLLFLLNAEDWNLKNSSER